MAEVTGLEGYELKRIMRTGTVATIDNRNWELRDQRGPVKRLSQSRAIALDMEIGDHRRQRLPLPRALRNAALRLRQAAARRIEAAGHGDGLLQAQVAQHLRIGIRALEKLRDMPQEKLHSRKLRSFFETAFQ